MVEVKVEEMPQAFVDFKNATQDESIKMEVIIPQVASFTSLKNTGKTLKTIQVYYRNNSSALYKLGSDKRDKLYTRDLTQKKTSARRKNNDQDEYKVKTQKKDRNVTSNIIHHLFKYLTVSSEMDQMIQNLIQTRNLNITLGEFKEMMRSDSENLKAYVTGKHIKELWFSPSVSRREYCKIMRILSRNFLKKHGFVSIYASNKFNNHSKHSHFAGIRSMLQLLKKRRNQDQQL